MWLDPGGAALLCSLLRPEFAVLEFGAGGSTTFFSQFVSSWVSVEHSPGWAGRVRAGLAGLPWADRVTLLTAPPDTPWRSSQGDGTREQFSSYLASPARLGRKYQVDVTNIRPGIQCPITFSLFDSPTLMNVTVPPQGCVG